MAPRSLLPLCAVLCCVAAFVPSSTHISQSSFAVRRAAHAPTCLAPSTTQQRRAAVVPRMMFDQLTEKMAGIGEMLQGKKKITAASVERALGEVKRALLDADVNLKVTNGLIESVRNQAVGKLLIEGVTPDQQFVKIMYDELVKVMGSQQAPLARSTKEGEPVVILLAGLQGAGKTTAAAKLAKFCQERGAGVAPAEEPQPEMKEGEVWTPPQREGPPGKVLLVAGDVYRPAAIEQLQRLGERIGAEVFAPGRDVDPVDIARGGVQYARDGGFDAVIVDTAGRQVIDEKLMDELVKVKGACEPDEVLLVVDAMTGQEAATLTAAFNERVGITGAILTKLDGDSRGGSALSVQGVSGRPIKFVGVGERIDDLEPFYPDRMASRILGMGDIVSFVEKAQKQVSEAEMAQLSQKMMDATFDFNDFLEQSKVVRNMGSMANVAKMIPGMAGKLSQQQMDDAEDRAERADLFISLMLPEERTNPDLLIRDAAALQRQRRIAKAAQVRPQDVAAFISDFQTMRTMMSRMSKRMAPGGDMGGAPGGGAPGPGGPPSEEDMLAMGNRQQRRRAAKTGKKPAGPSKGFGAK
ncbi:SRP54-type protein [Tribonema minus]|uniref:signal-recognition-particle GTPase n=1 Tax=Tribonema minus TaxID=303371 RepID=A0A835YMH5_9STRA|nr:SRP54-type protein [Tribonema minus]